MIKDVIAVYPGRFQPMGKHHKDTYDWMVRTFGYDNSWILSSDSVKLPKSPFTFEEKLAIAQSHGIPQEKFINTKVPYAHATWKNLKAILADRGLTLEDVVVYYVVGAKDQKEDPRFTPGITKRGKPTYFQFEPPNTSASQLANGVTHGYLAVAPHVEYILPNGIESSGTELRKFLPTATPEEFAQATGIIDPKIQSLIRDKLPPAGMLESLTYGDKEVNEAIRTVFLKGLMK
jgi:hypothetical protein